MSKKLIKVQEKVIKQSPWILNADGTIKASIEARILKAKTIFSYKEAGEQIEVRLSWRGLSVMICSIVKHDENFQLITIHREWDYILSLIKKVVKIETWYKVMEFIRGLF